MTTLAIVGGGILGRSLIYSLAKEQKSFERITLFYSDSFTFPCTLSSTATVAPRGLTKGHSPLGDLLIESYEVFSDHVSLDHPLGVEKVVQYTAATEKLEAFKQRYPNGALSKKLFKHETYLIEEPGYVVDPRTYSNWLLNEALFMNNEHIEVIEDFVTEVEENERVHLKTLNGRNLSFDKVIFTAGNYNRFWKEVAPNSKLKSSRPVQGSYFEFNDVHWNLDSFALTYNGENIVWNKPLKRLLLGSTSDESNLLLPPLDELKLIYERVKKDLILPLPEMDSGIVKVGLREKAQKREPYVIQEGHCYFLGGLYKNGFSLALKMARSFSHQHL